MEHDPTPPGTYIDSPRSTCRASPYVSDGVSGQSSIHTANALSVIVDGVTQVCVFTQQLIFNCFLTVVQCLVGELGECVKVVEVAA